MGMKGTLLAAAVLQLAVGGLKVALEPGQEIELPDAKNLDQAKEIAEITGLSVQWPEPEPEPEAETAVVAEPGESTTDGGEKGEESNIEFKGPPEPEGKEPATGE